MDKKKTVKKQLIEFYDKIYEGKNTLGFELEADLYAERIVKLFAIPVVNTPVVALNVAHQKLKQ